MRLRVHDDTGFRRKFHHYDDVAPYEPPPERPGGTRHELRGAEDFAVAVLFVWLFVLWLAIHELGKAVP